ncbi:MAG: ABC transporter substrate-binding protein [Pseudomonadota bacterium]
MTTIRIMFSRYSAFYSPLIATKAAGFLAKEGLEAELSVASPTDVPQTLLAEGKVDLIQSAPSASFGPIERGETLDVAHFAQINQRDGFFLASRSPNPGFRWSHLAGAKVMVDHGRQPLAMFRYALHRQGVNFAGLDSIDAGSPDQMVAAFTAGEADYIHLQGPAPQQLEHEGIGHVVASVGEAIGPVAFSSLCATRDWLASDTASAFMRAYNKARKWVVETPADTIAEVEASYFEDVERDALLRTLAFYQKLGTWADTPEIPRDAYEVALDVFAHSGLISTRPAYDQVVAAPPVS